MAPSSPAWKSNCEPCDVIGVQFSDKKARCKVIWVVDAGPLQKIEVGVKMLEGQPCPWQKELEAPPAAAVAAPPRPHRRPHPRPHPRTKGNSHGNGFLFPSKSATSRASAPHMRTKTADINATGCYVETMLPLAVGKTLKITFWLDSQPVHTAAIVRTCDGGVGHGHRVYRTR